MRNGVCRGCGARIVWIGTLGGKSMPCDDKGVYYKTNPQGKEKIITPNGVTITCDIVNNPNIADGIGYKPHWATCPNSKDFKKKGAKVGK